MTFLVRATACQRPSIRNDVAAVDSDAADFDPSGFLTAPLIANQSAIFQNGQRLVGSRNGLYGISVRETVSRRRLALDPQPTATRARGSFLESVAWFCLPYSPRRQSLQHLQTPPHEVCRNCDTQRNLRELNDPFPSRHHPFPSRPDFHLRTEPAGAQSKSSDTQRVRLVNAQNVCSRELVTAVRGARSWSACETTVGRNFRSERSVVAQCLSCL